MMERQRFGNDAVAGRMSALIYRLPVSVGELEVHDSLCWRWLSTRSAPCRDEIHVPVPS
jgi:hypothetical protein